MCSMPDRLIILPRDRLPESSVERHTRLRDYFCDKDATANITGQGWELTLGWPDDKERHVDPNLTTALVHWGGIARNAMWRARRRNGRVLEALYDSWTLHSWSAWIARQADPPDHVTILHVDDHRDFGSPRLSMCQSAWMDCISGHRFDIHAPTSVEAAINSGAIGMGSFMTPFLHAVPGATVRHLCQPPKVVRTDDFSITRGETPDDLLDPGASRPALTLHPHANGIGQYRATPDVADWLRGISRNAPILVHVDMDYFNNRYDGDSDWAERHEALDPTLPVIFDRIDFLIDALGKANLADQVEDVVIAYSPGFFPSEYWAEAGARLVSGLRQIRWA